MADRIPLIVHPNARQIQELPTNDKLLLSGHLEFDSTNAACGDIISTGGHDATFGIFNSTTVGNSSGITFHCRNNAGNADVNVADFKVGTGDKIESVFKGEVTAVQPACLLTVPVEYIAKNTVQSGPTGHEGGQNEKPIAFVNETTRVGCTTSLASNSAQGFNDASLGTTGITSITVPSAGTYLVSAMMGGAKTSGSGTDQIRFALAKSGISTFPNGLTYPTFVFGAGSSGGMEFHANFTLPLTLSANDTLSVHFSHIGDTQARIQEGYFSVTKLH